MAFFLGGMDYARVMLRWEDDGSYREWGPYEEWSEGGLGDSFLSDFYWSPDGGFVYFTHTGSTHPCGYSFTTSVRRIDLEDGSLLEIPLTGLELGDVSFSPDVTRMAYRTAQGIQIHELEDGSSHALLYPWPPGYDFTVGGYVWSPDGEELAFRITQPLCDVMEPSHTSTRIINLKSGLVRSPTGRDTWLYIPNRILPDPIPSAALAMQSFLESLYWGGRGGMGEFTYDRAASLYAGSYDSLIEMNPHVDPSDRAALLRNACEVNGFQCLRLHTIIASIAALGGDNTRIVYFTVYLANPDGGIFTRGACCGADFELPQIQVTFAVMEFEDGTFKVIELPPYLP